MYNQNNFQLQRGSWRVLKVDNPFNLMAVLFVSAIMAFTRGHYNKTCIMHASRVFRRHFKPRQNFRKRHISLYLRLNRAFDTFCHWLEYLELAQKCFSVSQKRTCFRTNENSVCVLFQGSSLKRGFGSRTNWKCALHKHHTSNPRKNINVDGEKKSKLCVN